MEKNRGGGVEKSRKRVMMGNSEQINFSREGLFALRIINKKFEKLSHKNSLSCLNQVST
jgi:hypothetical protein